MHEPMELALTLLFFLGFCVVFHRFHPLEFLEVSQQAFLTTALYNIRILECLGMFLMGNTVKCMRTKPSKSVSKVFQNCFSQLSNNSNTIISVKTEVN